MIRGLRILWLLTLTTSFIINVTQHETCFDFTPDYEEKKHEIYFLAERGLDNHYQAYVRILDPKGEILNSSEAHPHNYYLTVVTKTVD